MKPTTCKACQGQVVWRQVGDKWQCFNLDGGVHWDRCSQRRWDQVKTTGTPFANKQGAGYANSIHGTKYSMKKDIKPVTGKDYKPSCNCPTPPWEHCAHTIAALVARGLQS